jgi:maltooligosyltrehalose trehalohydrolase
MHTFEVWAPKAGTLEIDLDGQRHPMQKSGRGWWRGTFAEAKPGSRYSYRIDGGKNVPDPRSNFQPEGVHGPSELVDHAAFAWADQRWQPSPLASGLIYELHVGTFTAEGTFAAAIEKLDYLADLGVTHVEVMPVNEFSGAWGWGYDGVDLYAPHHQYGTPNEFKQLINECHRRGLAVILDVVYNHFGPSGNYLNLFGPYLTGRYKTPWGDAVNLDGSGSDEVRHFFIDNALMWLRDYHIDGLRLDAVHAFIDASAVHFLEELATEVNYLTARLGKYKVLIAESELNDPRLVMAREAHGYGLNAQWADDLHHAIHAVLTGETNGYYEDFGSLELLAKTLWTPFAYDGTYSPHRRRRHGRPPVGLSGHHFVVCIQNHDQVGNRAQGDRLASLISRGRLKIAAALLLTSPYIPLLFQGEEFAASSPFQYFSQHEDLELGRAVSEGRTSEFKAFGWSPEEVPDPQAPATFERSKLKWAEAKQPAHAEILAWYKRLIAFRRRHGLTDGELSSVRVHYDEKAKWITVRRGAVEVAVNLAAERQAVPLSAAGKNAFCSESEGWSLQPGSIELPPDSVGIVVKESASQLRPGQKTRSASGSKA